MRDYVTLHLIKWRLGLELNPHSLNDRGFYNDNLNQAISHQFLSLYILKGYKGQVCFCLVILVYFRL
jgi:hypothetical protein